MCHNIMFLPVCVVLAPSIKCILGGGGIALSDAVFFEPDHGRLPWRFGHTSWAAAVTRCCPCARARSQEGSRGAWVEWPAGWWGSGKPPVDALGGGAPCWPWSGPPGWEGGKDKDGLRSLLHFVNGNRGVAASSSSYYSKLNSVTFYYLHSVLRNFHFHAISLEDLLHWVLY